MHFLKDRPCDDGNNHDIAEGKDGRAKAPIYTSEIRAIQVGLPTELLFETFHYDI